jgi:hypothetical protein
LNEQFERPISSPSIEKTAADPIDGVESEPTVSVGSERPEWKPSVPTDGPLEGPGDDARWAEVEARAAAARALLAVGLVAEARPHVDAIVRLAGEARGPRADVVDLAAERAKRERER